MIVRGDLKQLSKSKVQRKKTVRARPPRKCAAVGNIEQCPSPAAKGPATSTSSSQGAPQTRSKGRLPVKKNTKSEDYRKQAKEAYGTTKNTVGKRNPHHQSSSSVVDGCCAEDVEALKELVSFGFIRGFFKEKCKADGKLYFRRTSWKCLTADRA